MNDGGDIVVVSRGKEKNIVVMSLEEYNSIQGTLHLNSSKINRRRLEESIDEMKKGKCKRHKLIEK